MYVPATRFVVADPVTFNEPVPPAVTIATDPVPPKHAICVGVALIVT